MLNTEKLSDVAITELDGCPDCGGSSGTAAEGLGEQPLSKRNNCTKQGVEGG